MPLRGGRCQVSCTLSADQFLKWLERLLYAPCFQVSMYESCTPVYCVFTHREHCHASLQEAGMLWVLWRHCRPRWMNCQILVPQPPRLWLLVQALQTKLEKLQERQSKGSMSKQTEEELEGLRALLRCNVCHERQKDVIITKCMHMFCKPCIQRNLDSRLRKCPGCGAAFGTKDVHQFFFTWIVSLFCSCSKCIIIGLVH